MKINITQAALDARRARIEAIHRFQPTDRPGLICFVDVFQHLAAHRIECKDYMNNPALHIQVQMEMQKSLLENYSTDQYEIRPCIDLLVVRHPSGFGAPVRYVAGSLPWADEWIANDADLLTLERLDVKNHGLYRTDKELRHYALDHIRDYPVELADGAVVYPLERLQTPVFNCEGIFSIAQMLVGMENLFYACVDRPDFVHRLLDIITNKYIERLLDLQREFGVEKVTQFDLCDDSAVYLSHDMFREFCTPYMKRIRAVFPDAASNLHFCVTDVDYVREFIEDVGNIQGFTGFKPNAGIESTYATFRPLADAFGGKLILYPDTDPCIVNSASNEAVYQEVTDILRAFAGHSGVCVSFSTWSAEKSHWGMKACEDYARLHSAATR